MKREFWLLGQRVEMVLLVKISQKTLKRVKDIPLTLPEELDITVRGECYMPRASFDQVNQTRQENGESDLPILVMRQQELCVSWIQQ